MDDSLKFTLLEKLILQGIDAIGHYLSNSTHHAVILTDENGMEHYPRHMEPVDSDIRALLDRLPPFRDAQYFYDKNRRQLVYQVTQSGARRLLFLAAVQPEEIVELTELVEPARLALHRDIELALQVREKLQESKKRLLENVFVKNSIRMDFLADKLGIHLSADQNYAVMLLAFAGDKPKISEEEFCAHMTHFGQENHIEALYPIQWGDHYLAILTGIYRQDTFELDSAWPSLAHVSRWQQQFSARYRVPVSVGIGGSYCLSELHKSYNEARIALKFHTIKGKSGFVQRFDDLGIFRELFLHNTERICTFCRHTLDRLLEYDHDFDADLQITLRTLLDSNFNYKLTAERLFVHVNTVRYRCDKIEQLLQIDLSEADTRFNVYAAIRVGDVLKALDLLQPGYIGNIMEKKDSGGRSRKQSMTIF